MYSRTATGRVSHRRLTPVSHAFHYRIGMLYLDLDEAPALFAGRWLWSWQRPNLACVLRRDHLRGGDPDLATAVRDEIARQHGVRPDGPVALLTQPRCWGFCLNPVSVYFVWSVDRTRLEWLLLEVHNTPWNEQHPYVLRVGQPAGTVVDLGFDKAMHVSPFMAMDMHYRLQLTLRPGEQLQLRLENRRDGQCLFAAGLRLELAPASAAKLAALLLAHPLMSLKTAAAIYWQALRLKLKGVPYVPHPGRAAVRPIRPES